MKKLALGVVAVALLASVFAFTSAGGWAVIKVAKVPDAWIAGKPLQLSWQVRQHGVEPAEGLTPILEARSGTTVIRGTASAHTEDGQRGAYRGRLVFPTKGEWQVTIRSGFGNNKVTLLPWNVVDSVTPVRGTVEEHLAKLGIARFSQVEQGRRLFVAQGCISCHTHGSVAVVSEWPNFAQDLTDRRFPPEYLARFLADPSIKQWGPGGPKMPNLELREKEILPIVAFINAERRTTSR